MDIKKAKNLPLKFVFLNRPFYFRGKVFIEVARHSLRIDVLEQLQVCSGKARKVDVADWQYKYDITTFGIGISCTCFLDTWANLPSRKTP